jgi:hypothetical protein
MNEEVSLLKNKPSSNPYWQQKLWSWDPVMTPTSIIGLLALIGIIFVSVGPAIVAQSNSLYDEGIIYGGTGAIGCSIDSTCTIDFTLSKDVDGPLYVYYELTNFYQNNIRYSASIPWDQLLGEYPSEETLEDICDPESVLKNSEGHLYYPCGLVARSFFNDEIYLNIEDSTINGINPSTTGISTTSINPGIDSSLYVQPKGFEYVYVSTCAGFTTASCSKLPSNPSTCKCYSGSLTNTPYIHYYPQDGSIEYLYETYPNIIEPKEGVSNEHIKNWMNIAALPDFRKLYGHIGGPLKKGDVISFTVQSNYNVGNWDGTKAIVLSEKYALGLPNDGLGIAYTVSGSICIVVAFIFLLKQLLAPRAIGSPELLNWK